MSPFNPLDFVILIHSIFIILLCSPVTLVVSVPSDLGISQDPSEDFLPFDTSSGLGGSFLDDNNDDLFADSSIADDLDSFDLEASCSPRDGQPPAKLPGRGGFCGSNDQPSLDGLIKTLGIFGNPSEKQEDLEGAASSTKITVGSPCPPNFPVHLCCEDEGEYIGELTLLIPLDVYLTMTNCEPGTS